MAYSDPRTWVTGELVTAALMNAQLRDNLDAVIDGATGTYVNTVVGPHSIGGSSVDYVRLQLIGSFTSGGASTVAFGTYTGGAITGHSADSVSIAGMRLDNAITTAGNCTTVAQLSVNEPQITVGSGTVTNSASIYVQAAATEATNDYALWVDSGATQLDGNLTVGGVATVTGDLNVDSGGLFVESDNSYVGMGTTSPASALHVTPAVAAAVNNHMKGVQLSPSVTGYPGWEIYGISCTPTMVEGGSDNAGNIVGVLVAPTVTNDAGATCTTASSIKTNAFAAPTGTTNATGLNCTAPTGATNNSAACFIGGDIGIGTLTPGFTSPSRGLTVLASTQARIELVGTRTSDDVVADVTFMNSGGSQTIGIIRSNRSGANNSGSLTFHTYNAGSNVTALTLSPAGALSKASGSFKIDHPHPDKNATHHLIHSFVEAPKADLIYRGRVTLAAGSATVDLDDAAGMTIGTWALLCRSDTAQCYTTNETGGHHVRGAVSGSTLTIDCEEECDDEVSWMVIGERKDQHMLDTDWTDEEGRVIVEPEKPPTPEEEDDD